MKLYKSSKFAFRCSDCDYHSTIKGLWATITRYPDNRLYSFTCIVCDARKVAKKNDIKV
jgi:hypothetical protein